mgnify:CR=1 FL=1
MGRFKEKGQFIQAWGELDDPTAYRLIIDCNLNVPLLFWATEATGDPKFREIATKHINTAASVVLREDSSTHHTYYFDPETGKPVKGVTAQGASDNSAWARGQAWAIYGYTVCFRETKDRKYLDQALKTFEFMKNHKNMPADLVPYWDLDAPNIPNEPRDASSASVIASALYEICTYPVENPQSYKEYADKIMESLATADYTAPLGENGRFLLMHSVGSIPHNSEIDVPLNYADYYYLEALKRKIDLEK